MLHSLLLFLQCLLNGMSNWSFDVFSLDKLSRGRPVVHMVLKLFEEHNLMEHFSLDIVKLMRFASKLVNMYCHAVHSKAYICLYLSQT